MNLFRSLLPGMVASLLLGIFTTVPVSNAQPRKGAQPAETPIVDAWRIDEPWRPSFADVLKAKSAMEGRTPDQLAAVNVLRVLANCADVSAKAAPQHRLPTIPELGAGGADLSNAPELTLRLAALLRGGFPATGKLTTETLLFLNSPSNAEGGFSSALLDLLVCDAVCARGDDAFVTLQAMAAARAKETCVRLNWTSIKPAATPTADQLRSLACEALCRRLAAERGWAANLPDGWEQVLDCLCRLVRPKEALWPEAKPEPADDAASARGLLWLGALLSAASREKNIDTNKGLLARKYDAAVRSVQRASGETCANKNVCVDLDGSSLLALFSADMEPDAWNPLHDHLARRTLDYFTAVDFTPSGLDLAWSLGWVAGTGQPLPQDAAGTSLPAPELDDRRYVAQLSLSLLGFCGGLQPAGPCAPVGAPAEFNSWSAALAVLDADGTTTLEDRIRNAISRATDWLKKQQLPDGTFAGDYSSRLGGHCLNMLALLDAGVPRDDACIRKAMHALSELAAGQPAAQLDGPVYSYSVALLMLQKYYEDEQIAAKILDATEPGAYRKATAKVWRRVSPEHRKMIDKMVATLTKDDHGYGWSYFGLATEDGTAESFGDSTWRDNSNSQYAVMGLKAASLLGADFDRKVLAAEARRLVRCYRPDASMPAIRVKLEGADDKKHTDTGQRASIVPGGWDYTSPASAPSADSPAACAAIGMTAAGVSSLVICRDELHLQGRLDAALKSDIDLHIHGALHWIGARFAYRYMRGFAMSRIYAEGWGKYYDLYSIERAGVLSNVRRMAAVEWYAQGARLLVETQQQDGGWPDIVGKQPTESAAGPDIVDHCFAIPFLKRAVVPVTSKPVITQDDH